MKTAKLLKLAYAAQWLGREVFGAGAPQATVRTRRRAWAEHGMRTARHAWSEHAPRAARHPFLAGFGGAFVGLLAFALVIAALGAVFALLGVVLKLALGVGAVVLAVRFARRWRRPATQVLIVPPEYRSHAARPRS